MFNPHQYFEVLVSDLGILIWMGAVGAAIFQYGFLNVFCIYLVPYLW